jgi:hypothetical protein
MAAPAFNATKTAQAIQAVRSLDINDTAVGAQRISMRVDRLLREGADPGQIEAGGPDQDIVYHGLYGAMQQRQQELREQAAVLGLTGDKEPPVIGVAAQLERVINYHHQCAMAYTLFTQAEANPAAYKAPTRREVERYLQDDPSLAEGQGMGEPRRKPPKRMSGESRPRGRRAQSGDEDDTKGEGQGGEGQGGEGRGGQGQGGGGRKPRGR